MFSVCPSICTPRCVDERKLKISKSLQSRVSQSVQPHKHLPAKPYKLEVLEHSLGPTLSRENSKTSVCFSVCLSQGHAKEILLGECSILKKDRDSKRSMYLNSFNECLCLWLMWQGLVTATHTGKPETNVFKHCAACLSSFWRWKSIAKYGWDSSATFLTEASKRVRWTGSQTVGTPTTKQVSTYPEGSALTFVYSQWMGRVRYSRPSPGTTVRGTFLSVMYLLNSSPCLCKQP